MSREATNWAWGQEGLTSQEKFVLIALSSCHNINTGKCCPKQETLAKTLCVSERSVRRSLMSLEAKGLICREIRRSSKTGQNVTTDYILKADFKPEPQDTVSDGLQDSMSASLPDNLSAEPQDTVSAKKQNIYKQNSKNITPYSPPIGSKDFGFEDFWEAYPKKVGKGSARKAFEKALELDTAQAIVLSAQNYAHTGNRKFIKNPATWLNQECWNDAPESQPGNVERQSKKSTDISGIMDQYACDDIDLDDEEINRRWYADIEAKKNGTIAIGGMK